MAEACSCRKASILEGAISHINIVSNCNDLVIDNVRNVAKKPSSKSSSQISNGIGEVPRTLCAWVADVMKFKALIRL